MFGKTSRSDVHQLLARPESVLSDPPDEALNDESFPIREHNLSVAGGRLLEKADKRPMKEVIVQYFGPDDKVEALQVSRAFPVYDPEVNVPGIQAVMPGVRLGPPERFGHVITECDISPEQPRCDSSEPGATSEFQHPKSRQ